MVGAGARSVSPRFATVARLVNDLRVLVTTRRSLVGLGLLLVACEGSPVEPFDAGAPMEPTVEIGTGELEFEPIEDGQELELILGPQGGYHFLASMQVTGVEPGTRTDLNDPRNPTTEFRAWVGDTRVDLRASSYTQGLDLQPDGEGYEMIGRLLILDITSNSELAGMATRVEVLVTDADGIMLQDDRTVVAVPSPQN